LSLSFLSFNAKIIIFRAHKYKADDHVNVVRHDSFVSFFFPFFFAEFPFYLATVGRWSYLQFACALQAMLVFSNAIDASVYEDLTLITPINLSYISPGLL